MRKAAASRFLSLDVAAERPDESGVYGRTAESLSSVSR
jgi:hypothetical protein